MTAGLPEQGGRPLFAVLLAGGKGTRFWPASRTSHPKQFLALFGTQSLLRLTFERFAGLVPVERILVVTNPSYAARTRSELPELPPGNLLLEPSGRNTAPAAALAARVARERDADPVLVIAPTDHVIKDEGAFAKALSLGMDAANDDALVTFGVVPDRAATMYGYIEVETPAPGGGAVAVRRFREKPGPAEAAAFVESGRFYWNAGIFLWGAAVFERELSAASPDVASALSGLPPRAGPGEPGFEAFRMSWEGVPSISIDYALLEKASRVMVVPLAAGWSDVGGWDAVHDLMTQDDAGNRPSDDVLYIGARDCSVHRMDPEAAPDAAHDRRRLYALVETEGVIVVETPDAVLICRRGAGETLRDVVKRLADSGRGDLL